MEKQDYAQIFNRLVQYVTAMNPSKLPIVQQDISYIVKRATMVLKKTDRIIWFLKTFRALMATEDVAASDQGPFLAQYEKDFGEPFDKKFLGDEVDLISLEHYFSLAIPAIQNLIITQYTPHQLVAFLKEQEVVWRESLSVDGMVDDDAKPILDFGNGWRWVDTEKAYCPNEAQHMGHCGNQPRSHSTDHLLSLRKALGKNPDGQMVWRSSLTFILCDDGMLTEMKGRGNSKPAPRYYDMIVALLKLPIIKGIVGGGYMPENNFSLDDLAPEVRAQLVDEKPSLGNVMDVYRKFQSGEMPPREFLPALNEQLAKISPDLKVPFVAGDMVDCIEEVFDDYLGMYSTNMQILLNLSYGNTDVVLKGMTATRYRELFDSHVIVSQAVKEIETENKITISPEVISKMVPSWIARHGELIKAASQHMRQRFDAALHYHDSPFEISIAHDYVSVRLPLAILVEQMMLLASGGHAMSKPVFTCLFHQSWDYAIRLGGAIKGDSDTQEIAFITSEIYADLLDKIDHDLIQLHLIQP